MFPKLKSEFRSEVVAPVSSLVVKMAGKKRKMMRMVRRTKRRKTRPKGKSGSRIATVGRKLAILIILLRRRRRRKRKRIIVVGVVFGFFW